MDAALDTASIGAGVKRYAMPRGWVFTVTLLVLSSAAGAETRAVFDDQGTIYAVLDIDRSIATRLNRASAGDRSVTISVFQKVPRSQGARSLWSPRSWIQWGNKNVPMDATIDLSVQVRRRLPDGKAASGIQHYDALACTSCSVREIRVRHDADSKPIGTVGARAVVSINGQTRTLGLCDGDCRGMDQAFRE